VKVEGGGLADDLEAPVDKLKAVVEIADDRGDVVGVGVDKSGSGPIREIKYLMHGSIARAKRVPEAGQPWRMPLLMANRRLLLPISMIVAKQSR
jgi:hypothetical protein